MSAASQADDQETGTSAWAPLRHSAFAIIWGATLLSNIGTWMNDVGAGWLMTSLSSSPTLVALVQTATTLPVFLFGLPAGAMADTVDKRKLLLIMQATMAVLASSFALLVWLELVTPLLLLAFTFLMGSCTAFVAPAMQAVLPQLVPRAELQQAIALGGVGVNLSRAIGPALGGMLIVAFGIFSPFALNALSFIGIILALLWWRPVVTKPQVLPAEPMPEAIRAGLYYALASVPLRATLIRAVVFFVSASAFWALLPLIARNILQGGASLYGLLLGSVGAGAVTSAVFLPRVRKFLGADQTVIAGTVMIAAVMALVGLLTSPVLAVVLCFAYGFGWIAVLSTLNISAQLALPDWVRGRGLAVYLTVFFGAMSAGSIIWGQVSSHFSIASACIAAAVLALVGILLTRTAILLQGEGVNLAPSMHWPQPVVSAQVTHDKGPVMTVIRYRVRPENRAAFLARMAELRLARKRLGAYAWDIMEDAAETGLFTECFCDLSWLAHLRHHDRVTVADRALQDAARALTENGNAVQVTHLVSQRNQFA